MMMSIRELRLLLEISQDGFEEYKKHERDLLVLEKAKMIRKDHNGDWHTTMDTDRKIGAILNLL